MRKLISTSVLCVSLAILLGACSSGKMPFSPSKQVDFDSGYTVSADITCGKLDAKADITRNGKNDWEFTFSEPKALMGLTLHLTDGEMSANLGGLNVSAQPKGVYASLPGIIAQAVDKLPEIQESMTEKDGVLTAESEFDGQKVIITAAGDSGELISLKCPYHKLSVHFSEQQKISPPETKDPASDSEVMIIEE